MIIAEHGFEVGRAGTENSAVAGKLAALHADNHISEKAAVAELIEHLKDSLWMWRTRAEVKDIAYFAFNWQNLKEKITFINMFKKLWLT